MRRRGLIAAAAAVVAALGAAVALVDAGDRGAPRSPQRAVTLPGTAARAAAGTHARFVTLARQRTNRCDLQAGELMSDPPGRRLQGACCSAMDEAAYRRQVDSLRRYRAEPDIPHDPYDIPAGLAQRLLRYDRTVKLTADGRRTYRQAMRMTREHGPCCCRCWRWTAFRGLSKQLITSRDLRAPELARLIEALDGCGGSADGDGVKASRA